ncbi:MAG: helix-turn-helix domain-containing protein [Clostridia bacterium]
MAGNESEQTILKELSLRIKQYRISLNLTQAELAEKAGVSSSTVVRLEDGADLKISNYLKILSSLGLAQNLDILIPEPQEDFKALYEKKPPRQRVKQSMYKTKTNWVWGEDK